jgi:hypothetical protein
MNSENLEQMKGVEYSDSDVTTGPTWADAKASHKKHANVCVLREVPPLY